VDAGEDRALTPFFQEKALIPFPVLVADIGGTNIRFAWLDKPGDRPTSVLRLLTADHGDIVGAASPAIAHFGGRPASLLVAAAGAVDGRQCLLTNASSPGGRFVIDGRQALISLDLAEGILFNDFEALSLSLAVLPEGATMPLGSAMRDPNGPRLVVGPGTGLGVGGLIEAGGRLLPLPSEGGHTALVLPGLADQLALAGLTDARGRLSAEDILSGRGLLRLASAMRGKNYATGAEVTEAALGPHDATARLSRRFRRRHGARLQGDRWRVHRRRHRAALCRADA
jgi:glucokinase